MKVNINRDLEEAYRDEFIKGFSVREAVFICIGLGFSGTVAGILWKGFHLPIDVAVYPSILAAVPVIALGFYKIHRMPVWTYIRTRIYHHKTRILIYDTGELPPQPARHMSRLKKKKGKGNRNGKKIEPQKKSFHTVSSDGSSCRSHLFYKVGSPAGEKKDAGADRNHIGKGGGME